MKTQLLVTLALFGCLNAGLAGEPGRNDSALKTTNAPPVTFTAAKGKSQEAMIVIGHIEKRDRVITIKSSVAGRVYTVATKEGKVLHENLSAGQLKAQAPEIHEMIKTGVAGDARARPMDSRVVPK